MAKPSMVKVIGVWCLLILVGGALYAQGPRSRGDDNQDPLLIEVRALREDLYQIAGSNVRTQVLIARLQLQEQRIANVGRQLFEVQGTLALVRQEIGGLEQQSAGLEDSAYRAKEPAERLAIQQQTTAINRELQQRRRREQELQMLETELSDAVNTEQSRWDDLNGRLDALERGLPARPSR